MERFIKRTLMVAVVLSAAVAANAQRWVEITDDATPVICISETVNEAPDVVEIFQNTQSAYHHDPRAPRFVTKSNRAFAHIVANTLILSSWKPIISHHGPKVVALWQRTAKCSAKNVIAESLRNRYNNHPWTSQW